MKTKPFTILILLSFFVQAAIAQKKRSHVFYPPPILGMEYPDFLPACELPNHKDTLVYTRFIYSGVDEYWSLGLLDKNCKNKINSKLEIPSNVEIPPRYLKLFKKVHKAYWRYYLIMDLIGTYVETNPSGYGHLGTNKSQFTVKYIINIDIERKNK